MIYRIPTRQSIWRVLAKGFSTYPLTFLVPVHINYEVLTICINYYLCIGTCRRFEYVA
jgi:hypothetical protein